MEAAPAVAQPSFPRVAESLLALSEEFSRCQNLPAVDGGLRLTLALEAICSDMRDMRNEMRTVNRKLDDLDRKVDGLDRRVEGLDRKVTAT